MTSNATGATAPQALPRAVLPNSLDRQGSLFLPSPLTTIATTLVGCSALTNGFAAWTATAGAMCAIAVTASVCSDLLKSSLPVVCRRLVRSGEYVTATACGLLLAVTLTFSGSMALSAALGTRVEASGGRAAIEGDRARLQASYDGATATLKALDPSRSVGELQALLATGAGVDPAAWVRTAKCTNVTRAASKTACQPYADASAELGRAQRRQELEAVQKGASAAIAVLPPPKPDDGFVLAVQRVAALWGGKPDAESIQLVAALLFVLLLELGSAIGPVVADVMAADRAAGRVKTSITTKAATTEPIDTTAIATPTKPVEISEPAQNLPGQVEAGQVGTLPTGTMQAGGHHTGHVGVNGAGVAALASLLERLGGEWAGGQVELAKALGIGRTKVQRLLVAAVDSRVVKVTSAKGKATVIRLLRPRLAVA